MTGPYAPDLLGEERRLDQPPLPPPEVTLAGQQAPPEDRRADLEGAVLDEVLALGAKDLLDLVGVAEQVAGHPAQAETDGIAVLPGQAGHEAQGVPGVVREASEQEVAPGSRRDLRLGHRSSSPESLAALGVQPNKSTKHFIERGLSPEGSLAVVS